MENYKDRILVLLRPLTDQVFSNAGFFVSMTIGMKFASAFSNFVILALMHPELIGMWQILAVIQAYASILGLGVVNAMNRELPFYLGRGDTKQAERIAGTAYSYTIAISVLGILLFAVFFIFRQSAERNWTLAALTSVFVWCTSNYRSYLEGTFRTGSQFGTLSRCQMVEICFGLAALPLVAWFGFEGFLIRTILVATLGVGILHNLRPFKVKPLLCLNSLRKLVGAGVPLFINAYLFSLANGVDRVLLANIGVEQVGLFAPVEAVLAMMSTLPQALTAFFYPKMVFEYGRTADHTKINKTANILMLVSIASCTAVAVVFWCLTEVALERYLPNYSSAKSAMFIALLAGVFTAAQVTKIVFYVFKSWTRLAIYSISYGSCKVIFGLLFLNFFHEPVFGIAVACLCTSIFIAILTFFLTSSIKDVVHEVQTG